MLVVIVNLECSVKPALTGADGCFGLDDDERNTIDQQYQIGAFLGGPSTESVLYSDHILILRQISKVDQADGDVLSVLAEGHRSLTIEPSSELLVGLDEAIATHAHDNGAKFVKNIVRTIGLGSDLWVKPDQRIV